MNINTKRLPYGNANFEKIMTENYAYIDKTPFIELLENECMQELIKNHTLNVEQGRDTPDFVTGTP